MFYRYVYGIFSYYCTIRMYMNIVIVIISVETYAKRI